MANAMSAYAPLIDRLNSARLEYDAPLAPYTTFKIGGPADVLYTAKSADELAAAVIAARETQTPFFVLGLGANILVGDKGFRGLVIRNQAAHTTWSSHGKLWSESGAVIANLIQDAVARGWSGMEHYVGIPSTVGGAVWQNLHFLSPAPERERTMFIAEIVHECELLTPSNERIIVDKEVMQFGYDTSLLHDGQHIALAVTFQLEAGASDAMHRVLQENLAWRGARHPWLDIHPSAGSIFRKIDGVGAGRLIDQVGLKGFRMGNAQISHIHANIMVNLGGATAADVRALISHAQDTVEQSTGHRLHPEIGFIGEF